MKRLIPLLFLASCNSPDFYSIVHPDGSKETLVPTPAMLGGRRTVMYQHRSQSGETQIAISQDNEKSFDSAVAAAGLAYGGYLANKENVAEIGAQVTNNKTAAGVAKTGIAADVSKTEIAADVTKTAIEKGITTIPR